MTASRQETTGMNSIRIRSAGALVLALAVAAQGIRADDFDALLKEIGGAPAAAPAAAAPAAATAPSVEANDESQSFEDRRKERETRADIKAALAAPDAKTEEDARIMAQQEEVRKQALEVKSRKDLQQGTKALRSGDYDGAIKLLEEVIVKMPPRPQTEGIVDAAKMTLGQAYMAKASSIFETSKKKQAAEAYKDMETARGLVDKARITYPSNADIESMLAKISANQQRLKIIIETPIPVKERQDYIKKKEDVAELLKEGRQYYAAKDYNNAEATYARVLKVDEYNTEAMRYLRKIAEVRYDIHSLERDATVADMMDDVRTTWTPPKREMVDVPGPDRGITNTITTSVLQKKMEAMIIPEINFRQANIADVVSFLVDASVQADPDKIGLNIILNISQPATPTSGVAADPLGGATTDAAAIPAAQSSIPAITLNLRRVNIYNAVKYICEVAGLRFRLEDNAVIITPSNVAVGQVVTKLYPIASSVFQTTISSGAEDAASRAGGGGGAFIGMDSGNATAEREDVKAFFERAGVPFPQGTSIAYNSTISKLIVANTPDNLEKLEQILAALQITPSQIEIEARFVELNQTDLQELGLEWMLTDDYEIATQKNAGTIGGTPSIVARENPNGITQGLRFFGFDSSSGLISPAAATTAGTAVSPLGNILTIAGVLTNPELQAVLHALDQHGASDILSAPRITTRSGVNAQIQVVREIIYPTEFETTQPQFGTSSFAGTTVVTPPLVTPGSFETREVGVILNVTPTVQPDGYSIDLVLAPEVSELEGWLNYGSTFGDFVFNIPQPIFNTRKVTTTIVIWDGQTVVMGGLIREQLTKTKDKIPLLGDIPLIGRLFRSEGEHSQKKNLMIFVTARLVDPAGKPIHSKDDLTTATGTVTPTP